MKKTARAPANIAFVKYWGKRNQNLRLPLNSSISMNLSNCYTVTTVEFPPRYKEEIIKIQPFEKKGPKRDFKKASFGKEEKRIVDHLERIRKLAGINLKAKVFTKNSFPASGGIASSASGFAALTLAATKAAGLELSEKELSVLARLGSGSACRSIPDGFVEWKKGGLHQDSFAYSLYPQDHWDLRDIIALVENKEKEVDSTSGMAKALSSPFFKTRLITVKERIREVKKALKKKDFCLLGETIEKEAVNLHWVMMTQEPPLFYWSKATRRIIKAVFKWRDEGLPVYFTLDAGPNVHLICESKDEKKVVKRVEKIKGVLDVIINKPAKGARIIKEHLF